MENRIIDLVFEVDFLDVTKLGEIPIEGIAGLNRVFLENLRAGTIPDVKNSSHLIKTFSTIQLLLDGMCELVRNVRRFNGFTTGKLETKSSP